MARQGALRLQAPYHGRNAIREHARAHEKRKGANDTSDERGRTMSEHKHNEHEQAREGRTRHETFAERDPLAAEEPDVLESSVSDPEFPAMQEFEVDRGGPKANTHKHPGLIWIVIAIVAVIGLVIAFAANGDWMNPTQAEKVQQTEFEEQTVPEDLGANENPEAA